MSDYSHISHLIKYYEKFENETGNSDLFRFSVWLHNHTSSEKVVAPEREQPTLFKVEKIEQKYLDYYKSIPINGQIGSLVQRLSRFANFYIKKIFEGLPFSNLVEFQFLAGIEKFGTPTQSEIISIQIIEYTTGADIIRRLLKEKLIIEILNKEDKRSKRLKATAKGVRVLGLAKERLFQYSEILTGNMSGSDKQRLLDSLIYLNNFHNNIYFNQQDHNMDEWIKNNIMK